MLECVNPIEAIDIESNEIIEKSKFDKYDTFEVEIVEKDGIRVVKALCKKNNDQLNNTYNASQIFEHINFKNPTNIRIFDIDSQKCRAIDRNEATDYYCVAIDVVKDEFELVCLEND